MTASEMLTRKIAETGAKSTHSVKQSNAKQSNAHSPNCRGQLNYHNYSNVCSLLPRGRHLHHVT
jgi:hypothetical protein